MYVGVYVCVVYAYVCVYACVYLYVCMYVFVCMCVCAYSYVLTQLTHVGSGAGSASVQLQDDGNMFELLA